MADGAPRNEDHLQKKINSINQKGLEESQKIAKSLRMRTSQTSPVINTPS
jgi:hypothetical protein